jgi:hypothetical protein
MKGDSMLSYAITVTHILSDRCSSLLQPIPALHKLQLSLFKSICCPLHITFNFLNCSHFILRQLILSPSKSIFLVFTATFLAWVTSRNYLWSISIIFWWFSLRAIIIVVIYLEVSNRHCIFSLSFHVQNLLPLTSALIKINALVNKRIAQNLYTAQK